MTSDPRTPDAPGPQQPAPEFSVVVPYYEDQAGLDLLLAALEVQTTGSAFEVVVADDGSSEPPVLGPRPFPVHLVRQEDAGFRAAAARNLGAARATGRLLAFLDGDMVPEPGYLTALEAALPPGGEDALVVGRRCHAELAGWGPERVRAWLLGTGAAPVRLADPQWLADGYRGTDNLQDADDRSYRFVISAVMAVGRRRFHELGGFVEFSSYGGEDWEFAHRWRHHGGLLRHLPEAVAWQDGSDFSTRHDAERRRRIKDDETLRLAPLLPVPGARDPRLLWRVPQLAVLADATGLTAAQAVDLLAPLVDGSDAAVWVRGLDEAVRTHLQDPRVRDLDDGDPEESTWLVEVHRPGALVGTTLAEVVARATRGTPRPVGTDGPGAATLTVRHVPTGRSWPVALPAREWTTLPGPDTLLEHHWARGL